MEERHKAMRKYWIRWGLRMDPAPDGRRRMGDRNNRILKSSGLAMEEQNGKLRYIDHDGTVVWEER